MNVLLLMPNRSIETFLISKKHTPFIIYSMATFYDMKDALDRNSPDIVYFDGGADVTPSYYGEENMCSHNDKHRDAFESEIFKYYLDKRTRFVGICRGSQFLNVMFGGSLHQDIPKIHPYYHEVINLGLNLVEKSFKVNSTQHQGVKVLASN